MSMYHEFVFQREHTRLRRLMTLQYIFFTSALGCMIALIWNPSYWVQIVATVVLLLFAGGACKAGRS
jgi:hypothetical protein